MTELGAIGTRGRVVGITAVALILVSVGWGVIWLRPHRSSAPRGCLFANEQTGEFVVEPLGTIPPENDAHGDPILVCAAVYSLDGGKTKQAAYYEKYTDEAKLALANPTPTPAESALIERGDLVRLPAAGSPWVSADSAAGKGIIASLPRGDGVTQCSVVLR